MNHEDYICISLMGWTNGKYGREVGEIDIFASKDVGSIQWEECAVVFVLSALVR